MEDREAEIEVLVQSWNALARIVPDEQGIDARMVQEIIDASSEHRKEAIARITDNEETQALLADAPERAVTQEEVDAEYQEDLVYEGRDQIIQDFVALDAVDALMPLILAVEDDGERRGYVHTLLKTLASSGKYSEGKRLLRTIFPDDWMGEIEGWVVLARAHHDPFDRDELWKHIQKIPNGEFRIDLSALDLALGLWRVDRARTEILAFATKLAEQLSHPEGEVHSRYLRARALRTIGFATNLPDAYIRAYTVLVGFEEPTDVHRVELNTRGVAIEYHKSYIGIVDEEEPDRPPLSTRDIRTILKAIRLMNPRWEDALRQKLKELIPGIHI